MARELRKGRTSVRFPVNSRGLLTRTLSSLVDILLLGLGGSLGDSGAFSEVWTGATEVYWGGAEMGGGGVSGRSGSLLGPAVERLSGAIQGAVVVVARGEGAGECVLLGTLDGAREGRREAGWDLIGGCKSLSG